MFPFVEEEKVELAPREFGKFAKFDLFMAKTWCFPLFCHFFVVVFSWCIHRGAIFATRDISLFSFSLVQLLICSSFFLLSCHFIVSLISVHILRVQRCRCMCVPVLKWSFSLHDAMLYRPLFNSVTCKVSDHCSGPTFNSWMGPAYKIFRANQRGW